ncbi:MAG TPA: sulfatase [Pelobium sp.]|nr:sulfatase [Pelobium sp.]
MKKIFGFLLLIIAVFSAFGQTLNSSKPNIVVFFIDDMGRQDLSTYGSDFYKTPAIDKLADGVKFTNAYAACTVCSPTRAALMTGKYPARLHVTDWIKGKNMPWAKLAVPDWTMYLDLKEKTIAESLKEVGYKTWHVGKWHLGDEEKYWPQNQGFDVNIAGNFKGAPIKNNKSNGYFSPYGLEMIEDGPTGEYLTDRLTNEAVNLIKNRPKDQPFFLNLAHYAVHTPIQGKQEKIEKYKALLKSADPQKNPEYAAMIESVDESIAKVMRTLEEEKLLENTFIVFATDNGALAPVSTSKPFKEGKGWAYEGGIRTPLLIYWKGKIESKKVIDEPAITMDIYSTIMSLAGAKEPENVDGKSLLPVITENKQYDRPLFWHYPHYHLDKPHGSVRYGDWKLIQYFEDMHYELYNLKADIGETKNLSKEQPEKVKELGMLMINWRKEVNAQMPIINSNYIPEKANKKSAYTGTE